ncbi:MAG: hypothetical protein JKY55_06895 [Aliivibrio sp.]|uniref:hypothetical protein n=1 Tax=Aliivibrio sp. TaxID=1872443 RepID=UPI001A518D87|nr:hypothetical protein [Aliivibrio sp.]
MGSFTSRPFIEFSESTIRYRRNILIASSVSIAISHFNIGIDTKPVNFLGIPLTNLTIEHMKLIFFIIVLYQLIHFVWRCVDEWWSWRLRLAGDAEPKANDMNNDSTRIKSISEICQFTFCPDEPKYEDKLKRLLQQQISWSASSGNLDLSKLGDKLIETVYVASGLQHDLKRIDRFESSIKAYSIQQNLRFHIMEIGIPSFLALFSLYINYKDALDIFCKNL